MPDPTVVIIGAGMGGLAAAIDLAAAGLAVTVLERAATPGGKMRELRVDGATIDAGPTVFTMRWVFEALFAAAGATLADAVTLRPADLLARHAWHGAGPLDLFADIDRTADAIGRFAGAGEARGYRAFCAQAEHVYATLENSFIRAAAPTPLSLVRAAGLRGLAGLTRIHPFDTLWQALGGYFQDPRLRQLFGRYATYSGASPFRAPATLMLIAHVERDGVWLVDGGMHQLAVAMAGLAAARGAVLRMDAAVAEVTTAAGRVTGVRLESGERIAAGAVVVNADAAAVQAGLLGPAIAAAAPPPAARSLSAVTWAARARCAGPYTLVRHNVFFSSDYAAEFADIFDRHSLPREPTVYVCAQDRDDAGGGGNGAERLLCLVNAPAGTTLTEPEIAQCQDRMFDLLTRCGLTPDRQAPAITTTPQDWARLFPATGGALYGPALHGAMAAFRRPGARTRIPGLYLAGGSTHPGPGVPMATLSGRLAAASLLADFASTGRSRRAATPGGISTRSAMTAGTASP